jgi:hypothetical protein
MKRLLALSLLVACGQKPIDTPDAQNATPTPYINNGTPWDPWTNTTETWTRNVVKIPGCTGTLLDPYWVVTAGHCFPGGTSYDMTNYTVKHKLADGSVETAHGAEVIFNPQSHAVTGSTANNDDVDIALVRLETPLSPGVSSLPIAGGTVPELTGETVFCAGYGGIADLLTPGCGSGAFACPTGYKCDSVWDTCVEYSSTPLDLRTASYQIIDDGNDSNHNDTIWYQFQVPNASGQFELPGDSGSTCWNGSALTGIFKAGSRSGTYNRETGLPAAHDWVEGLVTPVATINRPGARCQPVLGAALSYTSDGFVTTAGTDTAVICPLDRPLAPSSASLAGGTVWAVDPSTTGDVCCHIVASNPDGSVAYGSDACTSGAASSYQSLVLPTLRASGSFTHFAAECSIPNGDTVTDYRGIMWQ